MLRKARRRMICVIMTHLPPSARPRRFFIRRRRRGGVNQYCHKRGGGTGSDDLWTYQIEVRRKEGGDSGSGAPPTRLATPSLQWSPTNATQNFSLLLEGIIQIVHIRSMRCLLSKSYCTLLGTTFLSYSFLLCPSFPPPFTG